MKTDKGHDLGAIKGKDNLIFVCKGFFSEHYVKGPRMGFGLAIKWLE